MIAEPAADREFDGRSMIEALTANQAAATRWPEPSSSNGRYWYRMYGLTVSSELRLPLTPLVRPDRAAPALTFRRAGPGRAPRRPEGPPVGRLRCERHGSVVAERYQGPDGDWLWHHSVAAFHVAPDARRVEIYASAGVDEELVGLLLAGAVAVLVLRKRGYACLHASAVATRHGVVAFLGPHGQGKSTMAASFLRRGATLLTDDVLSIRQRADGVYGLPGPALMKVWPETAHCTLGLAAEQLPSVLKHLEKRLLTLEDRYPVARRPARIRALYLLQRYDPAAEGETTTRIERLNGREGLAALLGHTSWGPLAHPTEVARDLQLYARLAAQAPVQLLRFPHGHEHADSVYARVMADLEARA